MRKIELTERFTAGKMLVFALPSILQAFATTSFQMVDGYFVSNMLGLTPFASVGLISPAVLILYSLGFMFGEGASALIAQVMGEGDRQRGNRLLSMTTAAVLIFAAVTGTLAALLMPELARLLGATEENLEYCVAYGRTAAIFLPALMVNAAFMSLWITAEKGWLGMVVALVNGLTNAVLDWLFMGPLQMGIKGAALATSMGAVVAAAITLLYFILPNRSSLRFARFTWADVRCLFKICTNGSSSMVDSVAGNITALLLNLQLLRYLGEMGVAARSVYDYVCEFFLAIQFGLSSTAITVVGFKYGARKRSELDSLLKTNVFLTLGLGVGLCLAFVACAEPVASIYIGYDPETYAMAVHAIRVLSLSFIVFGYNLFISAFFTGLGNGLISAVISICDALAAPVLMMYAVPALFGGDAIWFASPLAMLVTSLLCSVLVVTQYKRKKTIW